MGTTGDYPPFTYREDGELTGYDIEVARMIADELEVKLVFVPTTWPNLLPDLRMERSISPSAASLVPSLAQHVQALPNPSSSSVSVRWYAEKTPRGSPIAT